MNPETEVEIAGWCGAARRCGMFAAERLVSVCGVAPSADDQRNAEIVLQQEMVKAFDAAEPVVGPGGVDQLGWLACAVFRERLSEIEAKASSPGG